MKIAIAQLNFTVGDLKANCRKIINSIHQAQKQKVDLVLFSELSLTGYPPEDLLLQHHFIESLSPFLEEIIFASKDIITIVGLPRINPNQTEKGLFNSAAIIENQRLVGYQDKSLLPTYDVFDEKRYFEPGHQANLWELKGKRIGITICEDIWQNSEILKSVNYRFDPIKELKKQKMDFILNLSASPYSFSKLSIRRAVCCSAAKTLKCPLLFCNQVGGNDSLIFDGYSLVVNSQGEMIQVAKGFEEELLIVNLSEISQPILFSPKGIEDLYRALILGIKDYFRKLGFTKACLGLSGGVDSALVACLAAEALGPENILGIGMPSRYSSEGSVTDAKKLAQNLSISYQEISIEEIFKEYLNLLQPIFEGKPFDVTEENLQARIRGMILMALSNKLGYIVLSTGNKSELAMGYSTLYGDMCGGLAVISDVTKERVYELARWINRNQEIIPWSTIEKPPSAELRPNQTDQDTLPEYSIVDTVLKAYVEDFESPEVIAKKNHYPIEVVNELVKRIHLNEYKRRQGAPGLRVSEKAFSVGRRFPIVEGSLREGNVK